MSVVFFIVGSVTAAFRTVSAANWYNAFFSNGVSPQSIARQLNAERVPGHKGRKWRDTTIRGRAGYGEGIINNETYLAISWPCSGFMDPL
ncbi:MAG: hypothetical protein EOO48_08220 [Flavobacterium sp.]|nr:MAG: hypothetical protein EOO48_08220 [Flavobacterium sp.]